MSFNSSGPPRTRAEARARRDARRQNRDARRGGQPPSAPGLAQPTTIGPPATAPGFTGALTPSGFPAGEVWVAAPGGQVSPPEEAVQPPAPPSVSKTLLARHGAVIAPFAYGAMVEILAAANHFLIPGELHRFLAALVCLVCGWIWALIRTKARTSAIRRTALWSAFFAGLWWITVGLWTPYDHLIFGWSVMQVLLMIGWLGLGAKYVFDNRHQPAPLEEPIALPPPMPPYLALFRHRFCGPDGELAWALADNYISIKGGFSLDVHLHGSRGTTATVIHLQAEIAKLYDIAIDQVSIEYNPQIRSEARARVTVITTTAMEDTPQRWDGQSTYNPETGRFELGRFMDRQPTHWQWHAPESGAACGLISGVIGSGKTGTAHRLACEAGLAKIDGQRIGMLLMGDPQMQPFSVWRGRADLMAWGPEACVELLRWLVAIGKTRAAAMGSEEWKDHQGRDNVGKGWFDPEPGFPVLTGIIDEWPLITALTDSRPGASVTLGQEAIAYAVTIVTQFRKAGIGLTLLSVLPDLEQLGKRAVREMLKAFNAVAHLTDGLSTNMLGIQGDPTQLPMGVPGIGYIAGPDRRPSTKWRTGFIPEYCKPGDTGVDVRHISEIIAGVPLLLDDPVASTLCDLGWTGQGMILDSAELTEKWAAEAEMERAHAATQIASMTPAQLLAHLSTPGLPGVPGGNDVSALAGALLTPPPTGALPGRTLTAVLSALGDQGDAYDVMERTGLDALEVQRAIDLLTSDGQVLEATAGRYIARP